MSEAGIEGWQVLLVEDDAGIREGLLRSFRARSGTVVAASCLAEARAALGQRAWDAVVLDLVLGDGDGFDLVGELRDLHPEAVIVAASGFLDADRAVRLQEAGVVVVPKPCPGDLLVRVLRMQRERRLRPRSGAGAEPDESSAGGGGGPAAAPDWVLAFRALIDGPHLAGDGKKPLRAMLELLLERTLEGRGASWRELAGALGRAGLRASDGFVRQQINRARSGLLSRIGVSLKNERGRGYYFTDGDL